MLRIMKYLRRLTDPGQWVSPVPAPRTDGQPPVILISSCKDQTQRGDAIYNGGVKLYNLWVKLLRRHGYEAYVVTYDGKCQPWLIEHQPTVSISQAREWKKQGRPLRFMTGWARADEFIELADSIYFFDAEMSYTCGEHLPVLKKLLRTKIRALATHSRTQQAWYMASFRLPAHHIQEWSDEQYWTDRREVRQSGLVGYMDEGSHTENDIQAVKKWCSEAGVGVSFMKIFGDETTVLESMRKCDIFLGMNSGKHPMWGEGCPRSQQESLHAGCVLVAYDVRGNREYLIDGFSGILAERGNPGALADGLIRVMRDQALKERVRRFGIELVSQAFTSATRWSAVRNFLELPERYDEEHGAVHSGIVTSSPGRCVPSRSALESALGGAAYINDSEIPLLCAYASGCRGTVVEIGSAFGASASLILANVPESSKVHSVDSFTQDSMSNALRATESTCRENVARALKAMGRESALAQWQLHATTSRDAAATWQGAIKMLYLDGDHHYQAVLQDFEMWFPYLEPGGYLLIHDSRRTPGTPCGSFSRGWIGPTRLAEELRNRMDIKLVDEAFSLTVWQKKKTGGE